MQIKYHTIGQIAKEYHFTSDALRYYEEKGLIHPARSKSGYRLYTDQDIWRLNVIEELRSLQFPVERIRSYLDEGTIDGTIKILGEELVAVNTQMKHLEEIKDRIQRSLSDIKAAAKLPLNVISIKEFPDRPAHVLHASFSNDEDMDRLMKSLAEDFQHPLGIIGNTRMAAMFNPSEVREHTYKGALMFREDGENIIPSGSYLSICYSGVWNSLHYAELLSEYAKEHDLQIDSEFLDLVWIDIHTAIRVSDHISEVQVRIL